MNIFSASLVASSFYKSTPQDYGSCKDRELYLEVHVPEKVRRDERIKRMQGPARKPVGF
jgi:hypothetical protein